MAIFTPELWLICFAVTVYIFDYIYTKYLMYKLGAKPITHVIDDGFFGFRLPFLITSANSQGRLIEFSVKRFLSSPYQTFMNRAFGIPIILTRDPVNIKAMLAIQFDEFSLGLRYNQFEPLLGNGIFTSDGEPWKHSRIMLRPQFIKSQVSHVNRLEPHFKLLQKNITAQKDKYFDIQTLFFRFTLDTATEFLFGQSVHSLNDGENSLQFSEAFTKSQAILATRANLHELYFLADGIKFRQYNKMVQDFSQRCVDKVLNMSNSEIDQSDRYVFLYEMVKITRNPQVLRDQCLNILLAGRDTTASLLSFAIFELALNEPIWIKLRTEVLHVFQTSSELITFDLLKIKCPYLQAILHETLRLYPSVPRNARFAKKNTTLPHGGGVDGMSPILIKKGQPVAYFICATHVDEKFYTKDALVFRPERWCEEPLIKKNLAWSYLPFNGGPRICLGQQFALTEASYVLARLAQCYTKISLQPNSFEYPPKKQVHLTMSLLDGVHVKMSNLSIS